MGRKRTVEFCAICPDQLERKGEDWDNLCPRCADAVSEFLDDTELSEECVDAVIGFAKALLKRVPSGRGAMRVPTYYGSAYAEAVTNGLIPEFGKPLVPVLVRPAEGLKIVLGSHDFWDCTVPDIQIERRPNGWAVFLHPLGGCDASGYAYILDDGRSFIVPEQGASPPIEFREWDAAVEEVDHKKRD